jgi:hypothetical protein
VLALALLARAGCGPPGHGGGGASPLLEVVNGRDGPGSLLAPRRGRPAGPAIPISPLPAAAVPTSDGGFLALAFSAPGERGDGALALSGAA